MTLKKNTDSLLDLFRQKTNFQDQLSKFKFNRYEFDKIRKTDLFRFSISRVELMEKYRKDPECGCKEATLCPICQEKMKIKLTLIFQSKKIGSSK